VHDSRQDVDLQVGQHFAAYRIESLIGRGGMGVVYLAEDPRLDRRVALKVLMPSLAGSASFRSRFDRESKLAASLDHPHIIPIYEAGEADGRLYLAMRYVEGTDLKALLQKEPPSAERMVAIIDQVADALDAAHARGLVHRDVKPGNILVAAKVDENSPEYCYLCDFGLTKPASGASELTGSGQVWGTGDYLAPEQIHGEAVDSRTDVYALGCMVYECLTGSVPYPREHEVAVMFAHLSQPPPSVTAARPDLPPGIDAVIATAMAKAKEQRYPTCSALAADVRAELLGEPRPLDSPVGRAALSRPPSRGRAVASEWVPEAAQEEPKRRRIRVRAVATAVLLAVAGGALGLILVTRGNSTPRHAVPPVAKLNRPVANVLVGDAPFELAAGNDELWVALGQASGQESNPPNAVARLDVINNQLGLSIPLNSAESDIAVGKGAIWVSVSDEGTVLKVDSAKRAVVATIRVGLEPSAIAVGEGAVWVANRGDNTVSRISPITNRVTGRIVVGHEPVSITTWQGAVWVANSGDNTVVRIDPVTDKTVAVIEVGRASAGSTGAEGAFAGQPVSIAAGEGAVWVAESEGYLERIDPVANRVTWRIPLRWKPIAMAVGDRSVWLVVDRKPILLRVNAMTGAVLQRILVGRSARGIAIANGAIWVANVEDDTVSRVAP
jgi:YVTN family beta-propeller protein